MKIDTLEQLEQLVQLMITHKLDVLEVDNIKLLKTKHEYQLPITPKKPESEDDLLMWSADDGR